MTAPRLVPVLCACSWMGQLPSSAACPACHRPCYDRVTPTRLRFMRATLAGKPCSIPASAIIRMVEIGLITAAGRPRAAGGNGTKRPPDRLRRVTDMGLRVIAAVDHAGTVAKPKGDAERIANVMDALAEHAADAPEQDILDDAVAAGIDVNAEGDRVRCMLANAIPRADLAKRRSP